MAARLWARIIRHHRIAQQDIRSCEWGDEREVLREICRDFDVPAPMWFHKQEHEFEEFRRTAFLKENFMEDIAFEKLEIEFVDEQQHKSEDPRNQF